MPALTKKLFFEPAGPFKVPVVVYPGGRGIAKNHELKLFWEEVGRSAAGARGVYLFGMRAGTGFTPWYVGKAVDQTFLKECFSTDKLVKYHHALQQTTKGSPVLILLQHPVQRGKVNSAAIAALEIEMIQYGYEKNPDLLNVQHVYDPPKYGVAGMLRSGKGKPTSAAQAAKKMMR